MNDDIIKCIYVFLDIDTLINGMMLNKHFLEIFKKRAFWKEYYNMNGLKNFEVTDCAKDFIMTKRADFLYNHITTNCNCINQYMISVNIQKKYIKKIIQKKLNHTIDDYIHRAFEAGANSVFFYKTQNMNFIIELTDNFTGKGYGRTWYVKLSEYELKCLLLHFTRDMIFEDHYDRLLIPLTYKDWLRDFVVGQKTIDTFIYLNIGRIIIFFNLNLRYDDDFINTFIEQNTSEHVCTNDIKTCIFKYGVSYYFDVTSNNVTMSRFIYDDDMVFKFIYMVIKNNIDIIR